MTALDTGNRDFRSDIRVGVRAFTIIESLAMLVALAVFTLMCLGAAKHRQVWPFDHPATSPAKPFQTVPPHRQ